MPGLVRVSRLTGSVASMYNSSQVPTDVTQALLSANPDDLGIAKFCTGIFQVNRMLSVPEKHKESLTQLIVDFNQQFISPGTCRWLSLDLSDTTSYAHVSLLPILGTASGNDRYRLEANRCLL